MILRISGRSIDWLNGRKDWQAVLVRSNQQFEALWVVSSRLQAMPVQASLVASAAVDTVGDVCIAARTQLGYTSTGRELHWLHNNYSHISTGRDFGRPGCGSKKLDQTNMSRAAIWGLPASDSNVLSRIVT